MHQTPALEPKAGPKEHSTGEPCMDIPCPKCGTKMVRESLSEAKRGVHPAVYKVLKKAVEDGQSYDQAKETVKKSLKNWNLTKNDYDEMVRLVKGE